MRYSTIFWRPANLLRLSGREYRSQSEHTSCWGLKRIYSLEPHLRENISSNLARRLTSPPSQKSLAKIFSSFDRSVIAEALLQISDIPHWLQDHITAYLSNTRVKELSNKKYRALLIKLAKGWLKANTLAAFNLLKKDATSEELSQVPETLLLQLAFKGEYGRTKLAVPILRSLDNEVAMSTLKNILSYSCLNSPFEMVPIYESREKERPFERHATPDAWSAYYYHNQQANWPPEYEQVIVGHERQIKPAVVFGMKMLGILFSARGITKDQAVAVLKTFGVEDEEVLSIMKDNMGS